MKHLFNSILLFALASVALADPLPMGHVSSTAINKSIASLIVVGDAAPVNGVAATGTLTSDATAPSNGDTVTVGGLVYTFQTTLTNVARNVLIGASAAVALDNLKSAVNATAGSGTTYAAATVVHPTMEATTNTNTTQVFEARTKGTGGNSLATVEASTHLSFGAATLAGGINGTVGQAEEFRYYGGYLYFTPTRMTTSTATWVKSAQFTAP
jgi:hypothetical protein